MLSVTGISHWTAPVDIREGVVIGDPDLRAALAHVKRIDGVHESLVLSTCNRTEVYALTDGDAPSRAVLDSVCDFRGIPAASVSAFAYVHQGTSAARHALRVAVGLDSMVVGEEQILGQVRRAFDAARLAGNTGPVLNRLSQTAIATSRRVRRETSLGRQSPSVPRAAAAVSRRLLGPLEGRRVLVIGAGRMAAMTVEAFSAAGARITAVANRTIEAAVDLAARVGAPGIGLHAVGQASAAADIMVVCTGASKPVVSPGMLDTPGGRAAGLLVIDLGVPRGADPAVRGLPGVTLIDLDGLATEGLPARIADTDLAHANKIVDAAAARFEMWMRARAAAPLIAALQGRAATIVDAEMARARGRLQGLGGQERELVRALVDAAVRKLLHDPMVHLRDAAAREDAGMIRAAGELFGLRNGTPDNGDSRGEGPPAHAPRDPMPGDGRDP
jgi:glutamyl-tRNA reductase